MFREEEQCHYTYVTQYSPHQEQVGSFSSIGSSYLSISSSSNGSNLNLEIAAETMAADTLTIAAAKMARTT